MVGPEEALILSARRPGGSVKFRQLENYAEWENVAPTSGWSGVGGRVAGSRRTTPRLRFHWTLADVPPAGGHNSGVVRESPRDLSVEQRLAGGPAGREVQFLLAIPLGRAPARRRP